MGFAVLPQEAELTGRGSFFDVLGKKTRAFTWAEHEIM
jgi:hypothetical protein